MNMHILPAPSKDAILTCRIVKEACDAAGGKENAPYSVVVPDGYTKLEERVFMEECNGNLSLPRGSICEIRFPEGIKELPDYACFCSGLEKLVLPQSLERIGYRVCEGCENLKTLEIPEGVTEIGWESFTGCGLESIQFPSTLKSIGCYVFCRCNAESVSLPDALEWIGYNAFYGCKKLKSIIYRGQDIKDMIIPFAGNDYMFNK